MSKSDAAFYMVNRQRYGINTLWVELLCNDKTTGNADGTTLDGIPPFTTAGDISTPNPAYFQRVDDMLSIAATHGITLLLDAVETDGWLTIYKANGSGKAAAFGRYLGQRYKDVPNIIWMYGNDFQTWENPADDAVVLAVAQGIRSVDYATTARTPDGTLIITYHAGRRHNNRRYVQAFGTSGGSLV